MTDLTHNPFVLENSDSFNRWSDEKLSQYPSTIGDIVVEVSNPKALRQSEIEALQQRINRCNMAIYAAPNFTEADKAIPQAIALQFGLTHLDSNFLADDDGISSLTVNPEGEHPNYIPYTNRPINWHTDGYYNTDEKQIRGMVLHCVQPSEEGGENDLLDHELLYLFLRQQEPEIIRSLMTDDVMVIPPGTDGEGNARGESRGPVFSINKQSGTLHMRYTARKRNIVWKSDEGSKMAVDAINRFLSSDSSYIYHGRLESGMGLICNNVLHTRSGFSNSPDKPGRLLYRARYFDRIIQR